VRQDRVGARGLPVRTHTTLPARARTDAGRAAKAHAPASDWQSWAAPASACAPPVPARTRTLCMNAHTGLLQRPHASAKVTRAHALSLPLRQQRSSAGVAGRARGPSLPCRVTWPRPGVKTPLPPRPAFLAPRPWRAMEDAPRSVACRWTCTSGTWPRCGTRL
jgi:hypothetical protein